MSRDNEHLTPTPFEPASLQQPPASPPENRPGGPRWVVPALLALLALALAVVFWLPRLQGGGEAGAPVADTGQGASDNAAATGAPRTAPSQATSQAPSGPDASPWSDAQQARLRKEAQDVLEALLDLQYQLEERGAADWADEAFGAARAQAAAGDALYQKRDYVPAREHYDASLAALEAIEQSIPERTAAALELARQAIEDGDPDAAARNLDAAARMSPDSPDLPALRSRAGKLPEVVAALEAASQAEENDNLEAAVEALKTATAADPAHQRAAAELARVSTLYTDQRFNRAMSEGYAALDQNRFDTAREAFKRARGLHPDDGEADSALQELQASETAYRLGSLQRQGDEREAAEDWQAAVESYNQALEIDPSVVFAQEGLERARPRAKLQASLEDIVDKPERLTDPTVAEATARLLEQARDIRPAGPVLGKQVEQIDKLLAVANRPITVTLRSDQHTSVTVYKVARLGQFSEHELELRPGTYTAVGTRDGYRDVRRDFTVKPDNPPEPVLIACTEPI